VACGHEGQPPADTAPRRFRQAFDHGLATIAFGAFGRDQQMMARAVAIIVRRFLPGLNDVGPQAGPFGEAALDQFGRGKLYGTVLLLCAWTLHAILFIRDRRTLGTSRRFLLRSPARPLARAKSA
jgi:hypothetical protein